MIDINRIRENPEKIKKLLAGKLWETDFTELLAWDQQKRVRSSVSWAFTWARYLSMSGSSPGLGSLSWWELSLL